MGFSSARSSRPEALQELSLVMEPAGTSSRELFWRSLIGRFDVRLRAYLGRTGCSDDRVEEVLWDVWALAAEHEEELRLADEVWPTLHDLLKRAWAARRRHWRRESRFERQMDDSRLREPDPQLWDDATYEWVASALAALPKRQRAAVDFRFRWEWPYWAIAAALDTTEVSARVLVSRGLSALRRMSLSPEPDGRADAHGV